MGAAKREHRINNFRGTRLRLPSPPLHHQLGEEVGLLLVQPHDPSHLDDHHLSGRLLASSFLWRENLSWNHRPVGFLRLPHHYHGQHAYQFRVATKNK